MQQQQSSRENSMYLGNVGEMKFQPATVKRQVFQCNYIFNIYIYNIIIYIIYIYIRRDGKDDAVR